MARKATPSPGKLPKNVATVLTFSRPPLVFGAFACALWVMFTNFPLAYLLGLGFLVLAMAFDWIDGWFAERYIPDSRLGPLVDRMMDRLVLSIIFPVLGAGMFWRLYRMQGLEAPEVSRLQLLHALFVLAICVVVLMRDQVVQFLRSFASRAGQEVESYELTRLRTLVFSPMAVLLYAFAFYLPADGWDWLYRGLEWVQQVPLRGWFVVEIVFLMTNIVSITLQIRKYGKPVVDDICEDDEVLRRRILSVLPNFLTLMNGLLGIAAMVFASYGRVKESLFILVGAAIFDRLDGTVARRLGLTAPPPGPGGKKVIPLGAMFDDLSDLISFCIAPGVIFYLVISPMTKGGFTFALVAIVAAVYSIAGAGRLIYFTLDKKPIPGFFKGLPTPGAALLVMGLVEITSRLANPLEPLTPQMVGASAAVMMLAALLMNLYPVRYIHLGHVAGRHPAMFWGWVSFLIVAMFTPFFGVVILLGSILYLFSPLYTGRIDPSVAQLERRVPRLR